MKRKYASIKCDSYSKDEKCLQKTWGTEVPHAKPRFGRSTSDYDLHERAGGVPLQPLAAPNVRFSSKRKREVCNPGRKSNAPNKRCGSKRTCSAPSRKLFILRRIRRKAIP